MLTKFSLKIRYHLIYWIFIWLLLLGIIWQRSHIEEFHGEEPIRLENL